MENFPVIDLAAYLQDPSNPELQKLCSEVSRILKETGALLIKDPRCSAEDNDRFLDMMEKYFEQPPEFKRLQERPHLHYQVLLLSFVVCVFVSFVICPDSFFLVAISGLYESHSG